MDASGARLLFSTLVGSLKGGSYAGINSIALDGAGLIHLHGFAQTWFSPTDFPTTPDAPYPAGAYPDYRGFLARLNPTMSELLYSTLLPDGFGAMRADGVGNSYLAWPYRAAKIDAKGAVSYDRPDVGGGKLAVLDDGSLVLAGGTSAPNFSTLDTLQPCEPNIPHHGPLGSYPPGQGRITVMRLDAQGNTTFSTLLGGIGAYGLQAMARDPDGAVYLASYALGSGTAGQFPGGPGLIVSEPNELVAEGNEFAFQFDLRAVPHGLPAPSCLVNGASYAYAPAVPGMVATLYGSNLGPNTGVQFQLGADGRVPTELAGTTVTVGGIAAPILYSQERQIKFIVPFQVAGANTDVCLIREGAQSCIFAFVAPAAPGLFAGIVNQDGSLNSQHSAPVGSVISIFGTGMGTYDRVLVDGAITGLPFANLTNSVHATFASECQLGIGSCTTTLMGQVLFAGAAPGEVAGVDQINIRVPDCVSGPFPPYALSLDFGQSGKVVVPIRTSCSPLNPNP